MRGALTNDIQKVALPHLKREITRNELRLMAYIQYVMMNEQKIDIAKLNDDDRNILSLWREAGWIEGGASGLAITKEFWNAMCEILWLGYVVGGSTP